jgi:predicted transcriptional regulator
MLMSQRLNAILPDDVYEELLGLAESEKRTKSQMAAILIEEAIATRKAQEKNGPTTPKKKDKGAA